MKLKLFLLLLIGLNCTVFAQKPEQLISKNDVERIIKTLSADDMQGRATFTPGIEKAARFIENEYKNIELLPLSGNTDYRQNFSMFRVTPAVTLVSVNNTILPAENVMAISGAASFNWGNDPDVEIVKIGAEKNFINEYRTLISSNKKTLVLVDPHFEALFKRLAARNQRGSISKEANPNQQLVFVLGDFSEVKAYAVKYTGKVEKLPLFNIAGMIPGKSKKEEYVVFSGHYDHLGIIKPVEGDSIANGADDDASGTTAVIELAKYYKKLNNNERTLIFVAFTAEEIGEFGSAYFATQIDPEKTIAMFNIEMIGKTSKFGPNTAFITGFERSDFGTILQKNLEGTSFKFYPDPYPQQNLFYRSDNASLAKVGVPAHTISTDQIDTDKLYHTVKDELSSLDVNNITATIRAIELSSRSIVSGKDTPKRIPKLEE
ncbi:M28 family metallopeptidase [Mucilaginibacter arboris]|uniref:M20/M25/M40 family metallo-hydrolase n=1 Tax=Mucilaginibacter arboris TaxID=2682090 RepID=A0A7K1SVU0_9SPHI|nr:M20/M25/M40 family metallo-hydrolase [Mucilaginibacter arboris]MVN21348.1 M20/M25/M40 family metallo-hydrolase [Mucilaginibacter arboris]